MAPIATADLSLAEMVGVTKAQKATAGEVFPVANQKPMLESNTWQLSETEVEEIEAALQSFEDLGLELNQLTPEVFPLPTLGPKLLQAKEHHIRGGDGYLLLRGLHPNDYCPLKNTIIFAGLTSYIGRKHAMTGYSDGSKSVLQHVTEVAPAGDNVVHRLANQRKTIPMHTDRGDVVALYTLSRSMTGGRFYLGDVAKAYAMLSSDAARNELTKPWIQIDPTTTDSGIARPLVFLPSSNCHDLTANFTKVFIDGMPARPRPASLPAITTAQHDALAELQKHAVEEAVYVDFQPGDLLLFNNLRLMHARDGFVDNAVQGRKRHLMRLIVRLEGVGENGDQEGEVPSEMEEVYEALFNHTAEEAVLDVKPELFTFAMGP